MRILWKPSVSFLFLALLLLLTASLTGCASFFEEWSRQWQRTGSGAYPERDPSFAAWPDSENEVSSRYNSAPYYKGDIALGMSARQVMSEWGEPAEVHTAGNPELGYQKWIYPNGARIDSRKSSRVVYFERGQVAGWETLQ